MVDVVEIILYEPRSSKLLVSRIKHWRQEQEYASLPYAHPPSEAQPPHNQIYFPHRRQIQHLFHHFLLVDGNYLHWRECSMVRLKHRYLTVHVLYPSDSPRAQSATATVLQFHRPSPPGVDSAHLLRLIKRSVEYMYGDYGLGLVASSLKIKYWSPATSTAIIRVTRSHFRILWAALTWITELGRIGSQDRGGQRPQECVFRVVRCSGTIRKAEEDVIRRAKAEILKAKARDYFAQSTGLLEASSAQAATGARASTKQHGKAFARECSANSSEDIDEVGKDPD